MNSHSNSGNDDANTDTGNSAAAQLATAIHGFVSSEAIGGAPQRPIHPTQSNNDAPSRSSLTTESQPNERPNAPAAQMHASLPYNQLLLSAAASSISGGQQAAPQLYGQPLLVHGAANQRQLSVFGTTANPTSNSTNPPHGEQASNNRAMIQAAEMTQIWSQHLANLQQSLAVAASSQNGSTGVTALGPATSPMLAAAAFQQIMPSSSYFPPNSALAGATSASGSSAPGGTSRLDPTTAIHSFNPSYPASTAHHQQQSHHITSTSANNNNDHKAPVVLYLDQDEMELSPYQCLVRKQIEVFEQPGSQFQEEITTQGRNRPIVAGQVGLRCRHCASIPQRSRSKYAMLFPSTLLGAYQSAQNMANTHLVKMCTMIPEATRNELIRKRTRDKSQNTRKSAYGGGRQYWADCLRVLGVVDSEDRRLRFSSTTGDEEKNQSG